MSDKSDILKALKRAGFKLVESKKHMRYSNGTQVVAIPLGEKMSPSLRRAILAQISHGSAANHLPHGEA
jgi:predicted RNA binding protein YcfA (HicA-like mRNA interferase family)